MGATLGIEIFIIFLLAFFEGVRIFLGMYTTHQVPVVQKVNSVIHCISHYPVDKSVDFLDTYVRWMVVLSGG